MSSVSLHALIRRFVVCCLLFALGGAWSPAQADEKDAVRALFDEVEELKPIADSLVQKLEKFADNSWQADIDVFGARASVVVYFPDDIKKVPVVALMLPSVALSTIVPPVKESPLDVTLGNPLLFVSGQESSLDKAKAPESVRARLDKLGFGAGYKVSKGLEIYGAVAGNEDALGTLLKAVNLKGPLLAGYSSAKAKSKDGKKDAAGKDQKDPVRVLSLALPAGNPEWKEPVFLSDTSIRNATIWLKHLGGDKPQNNFEVAGTVKIAGKAYDLFVRKAFDKKIEPKTASVVLALNPQQPVTIADFFSVGKVVGGTLGIEKLDFLSAAAAKLPLEQVQLSNPYTTQQAFPEAGAEPDFGKVMFAGANLAAKIPGTSVPGPLLTANAKAKVFGFDASDLELKLALTGVTAKAGVTLPKLAGVDVAKAGFGLGVEAAHPENAYMKLTAQSVALGSLDINASKSGFAFAVPAQCQAVPPRPVGLNFKLAGFDLTKDFKVEPQTKDCLGPVLGELANYGEKGAKIAAGLAKDVADDAEGLASAAADEVAKLDKDRLASWGKAVDAKLGPAEAKKAAEAALGTLDTAIHKLDDAIDSLTRSIEDALEWLIGPITNAIKNDKKKRSNKIAERDAKRVERAATQQRVEQARIAEKAAAAAPAPYHDADLRAKQAAQLSQMALAAQQWRIAEEARKLPEVLKSAEARKELIRTEGVAESVADNYVAKYGSTLKDVVAKLGSLDKASQVSMPGPDAIMTSLIEARLDEMKTEILKQQLPDLPTMAFGKRVMLQSYDPASGDACMSIAKVGGGDALLTTRKCDGGPDQLFVFDDTGTLRNADAAPTVRRLALKEACLYSTQTGPTPRNNIQIRPLGKIGRCLKERADNIHANKAIPVFPEDCKDNKGFNYTPSGEIYSNSSYKCLDGSGGKKGDAVITYKCHGGSNQKWSLNDDGSIVGVNGWCVAIDPNDNLNLAECTGADNQTWFLGAPRQRTVNADGLQAGAAVVSARNCGGELAPIYPKVKDSQSQAYVRLALDARKMADSLAAVIEKRAKEEDPARGEAWQDPAALFFYDPLDGYIRHGLNRCLVVAKYGNQPAVVPGDCPKRYTRPWVAIDPDEFKKNPAAFARAPMPRDPVIRKAAAAAPASSPAGVSSSLWLSKKPAGAEAQKPASPGTLRLD